MNVSHEEAILPLSHSQVYHLALQPARRLKSLPGSQPQSHVLPLEKTNSTAYHLGPAAAKHTMHGVKHLCTDANEHNQKEELSTFNSSASPARN